MNDNQSNGVTAMSENINQSIQAQNEQTIARLTARINDQKETIDRLFTFAESQTQSIEDCLETYTKRIIAETPTRSSTKKVMWLSKQK